MTLFLVTWLPPTASYSFVGSESTVYSSFQPTTATSRWLPVKWRYLRVTSGDIRSRHVISCQVTASYRELQPCKKWTVQYTRVFGLLQPLPGYFRYKDVTLRLLPVTKGHVTSFPVTWLPPGIRCGNADVDSDVKFGFHRSCKMFLNQLNLYKCIPKLNSNWYTCKCKYQPHSSTNNWKCQLG